ncbi:hypothetical protein [Echinicola shivajiensis]|uniref:hypothetical protein n=1 Tax=Echinicola shivajiensis TaxID=1035916 RepID=UPI001BFC9323|nr:hypothetical protein [Echinicola shivajiensis]
MKKLLSLLILVACCYGNAFGQEKLYAILEFMKVDGDQEQAYWETENFWEKIHQERIKNGDIVGWDLWSLKPGGEDQGYQYLTVTIFDDLAKMLNAGEGIMAAAQDAYSDYDEEQFQEKMKQTTSSRDLSIRLFVEVLKETTSDMTMEPGMVAGITLLKAKPGMGGQYENAEKEVFYPVHQKMVDQNIMEYWGLGRVMLPFGSDVYASHIIVTMFGDYDQFVKSIAVNPWEGADEETIKKADEGRASRDLKWGYLGNLVKAVR